MEFKSQVLFERRDNLIGVNPSFGDTNAEIIVTDKRSINLYNVFDKKIIRSWTISSLASSLTSSGSIKTKVLSNNQGFTLPVLYDSTSKHYFGVRDENTLLFWSNESTDLNKCPQLQFEKEIRSIHGGKELLGDVIVVFNDGTLSLVNYRAFERTKINSTDLSKSELSDTNLEVDYEYFWSHASWTGNLFQFIMILRSNSTSDGKKYKVEVIGVRPHEDYPLVTKLQSFLLSDMNPSLNSSFEIQSCSYQNKVLSVLSKEQHLDMYSIITHKQESDNNDNPRVTMNLRHRISLGDLESSKKNILYLLSLSSSYSVFILGLISNSSRTKLVITVLDTKYATLQNVYEIPLPYPIDLSNPSLYTLLKGIAHKEQVMVVIDNGKYKTVLFNEIFVGKPTLANAIGHFPSNQRSANNSSKNSLDFPDKLPPSGLFIDIRDYLRSLEHNNTDKMIVDSTETKTEHEYSHSSFSHANEELEKLLETIRLTEANIVSTINEAKKKNKQKEGEKELNLTQLWTDYFSLIQEKQKHQQGKHYKVLIPPFILQILCNTSIEYGAWDVINAMLRHNLLLVSTVPDLIPSVLKKNELGILSLILRNLSSSGATLSAKQLLSILHYIVHPDHKQMIYTHKGSVEMKEEDFISQLSEYFDLIIHIRVPHLQLVKELKNLSVYDCLMLLNYLCRKLRSYSQSMEENVEEKMKDILRWITMTLDSHFAELILVKDFHKILKELQTIVSEPIHLLPHLEDLLGYITHLENVCKSQPKKKGKKNTMDQGISEYSIEVLHI